MIYSAIQYRIRCQKRPLFLLCTILILIIYLIQLIISPISNLPLHFSNNQASIRPYEKIRAFSGNNLTIQGAIKEINYREDKTICTVAVAYSSNPLFTNRKIRAYIKAGTGSINEFTGLHIGEVISFTGSFKAFEEPMNEGQFDLARYYLIRKTYGMIFVDKVYSCKGEYNHLADALHRFRNNIEKAASSYLMEDESGIMNALILGDKTSLDSETKSLYQNAGIAHILSLSGLHIATLGLMLINLLKRLHINRYLAAFTAAAVMTLYSIMTGMSVSTIRALIMFLLGITASLLGRSYDLITGAAISAVTILLANPLYIFDNGFLLSFFAIIGIGYVYPAVSELCKPLNSKFHAWIITNQYSLIRLNLIRLLQLIYKSLIFSLSIQISTLPAAVNSFYQISTFSVLINLFVIPLMTVLLLFGLFLYVTSFLAACISLPAIALPLCFLSRINALISHLILFIYNYSSNITIAKRGSLIICGQAAFIQLILYYGLLVLIIHKINRYRKMREKSDELHSTEYSQLLIFSLIIMLISLLILLLRPKNDLTIKNLYVGQGDCCLIYGRDTQTILIDAGSSDIEEVGKYNVIPLLKASGISKIDFLFISHMDTDHMSACYELLKDSYYGKHIGKIIISEHASLFGDNNYKLVLDAAAELGIRTYFLSYNDTIQSDRLRITCLSPAASPYSNINDNSLVLYIEDLSNGFDMIFTGDIGQTVEEGIITSLPQRLKSQNHPTYLKVAYE